MRYILIITSFTFIISGCVIQTQQHPVIIEEIYSDTEGIQLEWPLPTIHTRSTSITNKDKTIHIARDKHHYNWRNIIQLVINEILQLQDVNLSGSILVNKINNCTNISLNTNEVTEILSDMLVSTSKFTLISSQQIELVKEQLGLSSQDTLDSMSKAIDIAHNVDAQYLLYSVITDNINSPVLQMYLMLTKTGEIIWSTKININ